MTEEAKFTEQQAIVVGGVTAAFTMCGLDYVIITQNGTGDVGLLSSFQADRVAGLLIEALEQMGVMPKEPVQ
jgi:hypothetical protein